MPDAPVRVEPPSVLVRLLPRLLLVLVPWEVVRAGRVVCLVAQRVPPLVRLVRALRNRGSARTAARVVGGP